MAPTSPVRSSTDRLEAALRWGGLALVVLVSCAIRIRLLEVPLDRDEGEFAYLGQLMLEGVPPYAQAYNMKLPGAYAAYAAVMSVLGETATGIRAGLLVVGLATAACVHGLARRLAGPVAGFAAASLFVVLSLGPDMQGLAAKAEHFVALFATAGWLLLLRSIEEQRRGEALGAGLLLGLAFLTKQHAVFFLLGALVALALAERKRPDTTPGRAAARVGAFAACLVLPYLVTCALLFAAGVFPAFWLWTVDYAGSYVSMVSIEQAWTQLGFSLGKVLAWAPLIWLLAGAGLLVLTRRTGSPGSRRFVALFVLSSLLAITPGLYFRAHYYLMLVPAAALLGGLAVDALARRLRGSATGLLTTAAATALVVGVAIASIASERELFFEASPDAVSRRVYGPNPFPESVVIADYIRRSSPGDARIAVLGSEPQIYFYAQRRSASGYIYMYPLMEDQPRALEMQAQMIREVEAAAPEYIVFVRMNVSWMQVPVEHRRIFEWFEQYREGRYERVGVVELLPEGTRYTWDSERGWPPSADAWIAVLRRTRGGEEPAAN